MPEKNPDLAGAEQLGEAEAYNSAGPSISQQTYGTPQEALGARYGVSVRHRGPGAPEMLKEPYLMPTYHGRNGSNEVTVPSIVQTPLGGLMPSMAMPPPQIDGQKGGFPVGEDNGGFSSGVIDGWPDGVAVPVRNQ